MEVISNGLSRSVNYLSTMGISDFLDIIIVAYLIYKAIGFVRRTNSNNLAKGLVVFLLALWGSDIFSLTMINFLLRKTAELGLIALLILFQPELRRLLCAWAAALLRGAAPAARSWTPQYRRRFRPAATCRIPRPARSSSLSAVSR